MTAVMSAEGLALLSRTAAHLRPAQVAHRARLRAQAVALQRWPEAGKRLMTGPVPDTATGWPASFTPLDGTAVTVTSPSPWPSLDDVQAGRIQLLGRTAEIGSPGLPGADWQQADASQLLRFHLHYWDWAWGLAGAADRRGAQRAFAALWRSWRNSCVFGHGDAWRPYPTALRAWSWCGLYRDLVAGTELAPDFCRELGSHAGFLRRHLESDVGGNHLVKDLKALIGLGVFLNDELVLWRALRQLIAQTAVQVLADGGHYERAPAYHCQVLGDLIDVTELMGAAGYPPVPVLTQAIARMRQWLGAVLSPDGAVPLLNDGYPVPGPFLAALRPLPSPTSPLVTLTDTGLIRAAAGDWRLLADVGAPCPAELPAHAHADTLGCLVYVGGSPLLVDTGTSTYAAGATRSYERSTAAHNTLEVDATDSTEVWGAFRAGRRARVSGLTTSCERGRITAHAAHDGYRHLPGRPVHSRRWTLTDAGLEIADQVTGRGRHALAVRWHLAPGSAAYQTGRAISVATAAGSFVAEVTSSAPLQVSVEGAPVAVRFGRTVTGPVLVCRLETALPTSITTYWRRADDRAAFGGMS